MQNKPFRIRSVLIAVVALVLGWQVNNGYRFCAETLRKAQVCEQLDCDHLAAAGQAMADSQLPILK